MTVVVVGDVVGYFITVGRKNVVCLSNANYVSKSTEHKSFQSSKRIKECK